jgi:putative intracellular protease/amidase
MTSGGPTENFDQMLGPSTIVTHTFADAPALDVIIVPGGIGHLALSLAEDMLIETFLSERADSTEYIVMYAFLKYMYG